jgi:hypothetical protein
MHVGGGCTYVIDLIDDDMPNALELELAPLEGELAHL